MVTLGAFLVMGLGLDHGVEALPIIFPFEVLKGSIYDDYLLTEHS